jgi:NADPH:quinone reductase-like Zn-dependent oxidoreductase
MLFFFTALKEWVVFVFALVSMVHLVTWLIPYLLTRFRKPVDVKAKYGAEWALVTGGSSGIGRAIVRHLASQGLNVVIAAVDDKLLKDTTAESEKDFPKRKFRAIGVDLSDVNGKIKIY